MRSDKGGKRRICAPPAAARILAAALGILASLAAAPETLAQTASGSPSTRIEASFGFDSHKRLFIKPEFHLAARFGEESRHRVFLNFSYLQKFDLDLKGPIDFWVQTGVVARLSESLSAEASINHLCRHHTSLFSPRVLNLNEAIGRIWVRRGTFEAGLGLGAYFNSSPLYETLLVVNLNKTGLFIPELSFSGEFKWVNTDQIVHEAELALAVLPGVEALLASVKSFELPRATHFGLRLRSGTEGGRLLDGFQASAGVFPFYENYKLMVDGRFRLVPYDRSPRRLLFDFAFSSPVLSGPGFWTAFFPDRMIYEISVEWEHAAGPVFASWYGRSVVDLPVDKSEAAAAGFSAGAVVRNQSDFHRLTRPLRFEIRAGLDLKHDYDLGVKLGLNTTHPTGWNMGLEGRLEANGQRHLVEGRFFMDTGRDLSFRPFVGIRRMTWPADDPSDRRIDRIFEAGVQFLKWFR